MRDYAQRMVKDHQAADAKLKKIAGRGRTSTLPQSLDAEHQALKEKLSDLQGAAFDREYAKAMAKGHDKAVALFESASQAAADAVGAEGVRRRDAADAEAARGDGARAAREGRRMHCATPMARPIWNGTISFGLLNVPVQLYSGERTRRPALPHARQPRQLAGALRARQQRDRRGSAVEGDRQGLRVLQGQLRRARRGRHPQGRARRAPRRSRSRRSSQRDQIDPMYFEKPYYLVPGKKAEKGYVLLREVLAKTGKVGHRARRDPHAPVPRRALAARRCADARPDAVSAGDRQAGRVHAAEGQQQELSRHAAGGRAWRRS